ncbi:MAG: helicase-related protein [Microgenomates group bacterium]
MSIEKTQYVLDRLKAHFLPEENPRFLETISTITPQEKTLIEEIKNKSTQIKSIPDDKEEREKISDWQILGFLVNKYQESFGKEPFDEQLLALIRAIESYRNPKEKGKILQMATGEGKSSVVIPILTAFLYFRGEQVRVFEINPYLLDESYNNFLEWAKILGIEDEVGKLEEYTDQKEELKKPIVFGYWSDFIHNLQHQFLTNQTSNDHSRPPIMILDEADPLLNEEAIAPAVISSEKNMRMDEIFGYFIQHISDESQKRPSQGIVFQDGGYSYRFGEDEFYQPPATEGDFFSVIKKTVEAIGNYLKDIEGKKVQFFGDKKMIQELQSSKEKLKENIFPIFCFNEFFLPSFERITGLKYQELPEKQRKKAEDFFYNLWLPHFWLNDFFNQNLINAALMERGVDYQVEETCLIKPIPRFPFIEGETKIKVIPLSVQTGYPEKGKQFDWLTNFFLLIKEAKTIDQLPDHINIGSQEKISILSYYINQIIQGNKIFGFTGTAQPVAKRIREVYGLETTIIPSHYETNRLEHPIEYYLNFEEKIEKLFDIIQQDQGLRNTLIVAEAPEEADAIKQRLEKQDDAEVKILSSKNEDEDRDLYLWLSQKSEKRRVLVCVKMVGRGVDLKPDEKAKKAGFLLISLTPFKYQRSYQQLLGRVGRRGEKGEVYTLVSPEDKVFSHLSLEKKEELRKLIEKGEIKKAKQILDKAWKYWEEEITSSMRYWAIFSQPIEKLRLWLMGKTNLNYFEKELQQYSLNPKEFKWYLRRYWPEILEELESTYNTWLAVGPLTSFGHSSDPKSYWTNYVFEFVRKNFFEFIQQVF